MSNLWNREPVMFMTVIQTGIILLTSFGLNLTTEQTGAILAFSAAVLGFITRSQVSPNNNGNNNIG